MIVFTPFFLFRLGDEIYGQWVLINSLIASLGVLNLGLGEATIRFIAKYKSVDTLRTIKIANTTYSFYLGISISAIILLLSFFSLEERFSMFIPQDTNNFLYLLKLGLILFGIKLVEQIIFSIYKGFERFDLFSKNSVCSKTLLVLTNIFVVLLGYSLETILTYAIVTSFAFLIIEFFFLGIFLPGFSVIPKFDKSVFNEIISFGLWSWVQSIIGILGYQLDKFLVAYLAGVTVLAYYSIGFTIASQLFNVFAAGSNWIFPKVSRNELSLEKMEALYHRCQFILIAISSIAITIFYLVKDPFLKLWLGNESFTKALPYINSYCLYILFTTITIIPTFFTLGTSSMKIMTANSIFSLTVSGIAMYLMFQSFGPIGLVYGRTIAGFITIPVFLVLLYKLVLKINIKNLLIELFIPASFAFVMIAGTKLSWIIAILTLSGVSLYYLNRYFNYGKMKA